MVRITLIRVVESKGVEQLRFAAFCSVLLRNSIGTVLLQYSIGNQKHEKNLTFNVGPYDEGPSNAASQQCTVVCR